MAVCSKRPETPGFWTACVKCPCGAEVEAEMSQQTGREAALSALGAQMDPSTSEGLQGRQIARIEESA